MGLIVPMTPWRTFPRPDKEDLEAILDEKEEALPTEEDLADEEEETAKEEDDPADLPIISAKECLIALSTVHMYVLSELWTAEHCHSVSEKH